MPSCGTVDNDSKTNLMDKLTDQLDAGFAGIEMRIFPQDVMSSAIPSVKDFNTNPDSDVDSQVHEQLQAVADIDNEEETDIKCKLSFPFYEEYFIGIDFF